MRELLRAVHERARKGLTRIAAHLRADPIVVLLRYPAPVFEICLYNLFVLTRHPATFATRLRVENLKRRRWTVRAAADGAHGGSLSGGAHGHATGDSSTAAEEADDASVPDPDEQPGGLLFERHMTEVERARYDPPPPATTREALMDGHCCHSCWLLAHTDRSDGVLAADCLGSIFGAWVTLAPLAVSTTKEHGSAPCRARAGHTTCFRKASGYKAYKRAGTSTQAGKYKYLGAGHCERGFYAGWKAEEASSLHRCMSACSADPRCVVFAVLPGKSCR